MSNDPISVKKFAKSFIEFKPWLKNARFIAGLVILLFVSLTIYRAYFMKTDKQEIQIGKVEKGGTVVIKQESEDKKVGLEFFATSNNVGAQFLKDIGGPWTVGVGGQYNFGEKEPEPVISLRCMW